MSDEQIPQFDYTIEAPHLSNADLKSELLEGIEREGLGTGLCWLCALSTIHAGLYHESSAAPFFQRMFKVVATYTPDKTLVFNESLSKEERLPFEEEHMPYFIDTATGGLSDFWFQPKYITNAVAFLNALASHENLGIAFEYRLLGDTFTFPLSHKDGNRAYDYFARIARDGYGILLPTLVEFTNTDGEVQQDGHMVAMLGVSNDHHTRGLVIHDRNVPERIFFPDIIPLLNEERISYGSGEYIFLDREQPLLLIRKSI